jgi:hypothetical protein
LGIAYCTRDDVTSALDLAETARTFAQVDRLIDAASRSVEALCRRKFYPQTGTRYVDWPARDQGGVRVWLDGDREVISLTSVTSGGVALTDYFLEPQSSGPPYTRLELDAGASVAFSVASGIGQRSIALTGVFGACADLATAGTLNEALDASETGIDITGAALSVGHLIKVDDEYMTVTARTLGTTGATLSGALTASKGGTAVAVSSATSFALGEVITIDSERMLIVDIAGSTLIVQRGWSGSTLAAHSSGTTVYAPRTLTVERGACGTTAATHSNGTTVYVHVVPPLVRQLAVAETLNALAQESSGYARTIGAGEAVRNASGQGLAVLRCQVRDAHGRTARKAAI